MIHTSKGAKRSEVKSRCPLGTGVSSTKAAKSWNLILSAKSVAELPRFFA